MHLFGRRDLRTQFQTNAIGIEKINTFENTVIGDAQHFNAMRLQACFAVFQCLDTFHTERDVVDPRRCIGRGQGSGVVAQIKKSDERSVIQPEKEMGVGTVFARAGHMVALNQMVKRHIRLALQLINQSHHHKTQEL